MPAALVVTSIAFAVLAVLLVLAGVNALRDRRWLGGLVSGLLGALFLALGALAGVISVSVQGYRALTHEVIAARVRTDPIGPQRFRATVTLADSTLYMFDVAGDALYVDAHILKWHPVANILGLHTAYELDRVTGRYNTVGEEQSRPRTVHSLARDKPINAFDLARRFPLLRPLVDAEYGSATFVEARALAEFEVRVSTTGLLVRRVPR
ncbi:MAG TPA: hypothetical protein VGA20_09245 [Gemmatimonadales bacterium]